MSFKLRTFVRGGRVVPGVWTATFRFVLPDGTVFPAERNGPESRKIIRAKNDKAAEAEAEEHEEYLRAKFAPSARGASATGNATVPTFGELSDEWLTKAVLADVSMKPASIDSIKSALRIHILPFIATVPADRVDDHVIDGLRAKWIQGGYEYVGAFGRVRLVKPTTSLKTLNNRLTVINQCLKRAVKWKLLPAMPCTIEIPTVQSDEAAFLEHETYERIVEAATKLDPRIVALVLLGGDAGLRRNEIAALNLEDIDFRAGRLTVRRNVYWRRKVATETKPKDGKVKTIPCTPRLLAALRACRHLRGPRILYTDDGAPTTPKILRRWIERAEVTAGLPKTGRLHVLRHTFASHLAAAGVPARTIMELCRHTSLAVTQRYMHLRPTSTSSSRTRSFPCWPPPAPSHTTSRRRGPAISTTRSPSAAGSRPKRRRKRSTSTT